MYIYIYIYIKKNWRAAGLELTTSAPSRTIVTDGNCKTTLNTLNRSNDWFFVKLGVAGQPCFLLFT